MSRALMSSRARLRSTALRSPEARELEALFSAATRRWRGAPSPRLRATFAARLGITARKRSTSSTAARSSAPWPARGGRGWRPLRCAAGEEARRTCFELSELRAQLRRTPPSRLVGAPWRRWPSEAQLVADVVARPGELVADEAGHCGEHRSASVSWISPLCPSLVFSRCVKICGAARSGRSRRGRSGLALVPASRRARRCGGCARSSLRPR